MNDGLFYLYADLSCSLVLVVSGSWLLTDRHLCRLIRACHAFIACGALVNVLGIVADQLGYQDVSYGHVWPGEVIANVGTSVLLASWVWRSLRRKREEAKLAASRST